MVSVSDELELMAMRWLHWKRRCPVVMRERSPRSFHCGRPDVIGISASRHLIEIEVKRTMADFRANADKPPIRNRHAFIHKFPRQFYFLVPEPMSHRAQGGLPEWAGLMRGPGPGDPHEVILVVRAPVNAEAKRLTLKEAVKTVFLQTNHMMSLEEYQATRRQMDNPRWFNPHADYEI